MSGIDGIDGIDAWSGFDKLDPWLETFFRGVHHVLQLCRGSCRGLASVMLCHIVLYLTVTYCYIIDIERIERRWHQVWSWCDQRWNRLESPFGVTCLARLPRQLSSACRTHAASLTWRIQLAAAVKESREIKSTLERPWRATMSATWAVMSSHLDAKWCWGLLSPYLNCVTMVDHIWSYMM